MPADAVWGIALVVVAVVVYFGSKNADKIAQQWGRAIGAFKRGRIEGEREVAEMVSATTTPKTGTPPP